MRPKAGVEVELFPTRCSIGRLGAKSSDYWFLLGNWLLLVTISAFAGVVWEHPGIDLGNSGTDWRNPRIDWMNLGIDWRNVVVNSGSPGIDWRNPAIDSACARVN